jgi:hypothetical protein
MDLTELWAADHSYDRLAGLVAHAKRRADTGVAADYPTISLDYLTEIINEAEHLRTATVTAAREAGKSWSEIGATMGVTKQAAHLRYAAHD